MVLVRNVLLRSSSTSTEQDPMHGLFVVQHSLFRDCLQSSESFFTTLMKPMIRYVIRTSKAFQEGINIKCTRATTG